MSSAKQSTDFRHSGAREAILQRIRKATNGKSNSDTAHAAWSSIERNYRTHGQLAAAATLHLFEERLREYDAGVYHADEAEAATAIRQILAQRKMQRVLVPDGLPAGWLVPEVEFVVDHNLSTGELDAITGVMTDATMAIAETGTVVLQAGPGQGRRAVTLIPDYHLCIVRTGDVVETVVEAMHLLQPTSTLPTTFFSGPSATADIEMTRIKGVHGPRFLDVLLLSS